MADVRADGGVRVLRRATAPAGALRLSVVVPNRDLAEFVVPAVRSILAQSVAELEVVVVDDGSRDDSVARVLEIDDPRLTCIQQTGRGLAAARNAGIREARAPVVGFCDSDDVWHPRKAELQLAVLDARPDVGVCFSHSEYLDEAGTPTGRLLACPHRELGLRELLRRNHLGNGSTMLVRAEHFAAAGGFDETLASCEDWEMWVRLAARTGCRMHCVDASLTGYRVRAGSLTTSYESFVAAAELAIERMRAQVPGISRRALARARAEALRVTSRKAFSAGAYDASRRLLAAALRCSPTLLLRDVRALVLAAIHAAAAAVPGGRRAAVYGRLHARMEAGHRRWSRARLQPAAGFGGSAPIREPV